jgi:hypothetical protein
MQATKQGRKEASKQTNKQINREAQDEEFVRCNCFVCFFHCSFEVFELVETETDHRSLEPQSILAE